MTSLDIVTVGRVSVDLYAEQVGVPITEVTTFRKSIGGTATNVAVASARFGHRVALWTRVGDDLMGDYVRHALQQIFGVDTSMVGVDATLNTPLAFAVLDPPEDPEIIFYRAPTAPDMGIEVSDVDLAVIDDVTVLWVPASRFSAEPSRTTVLDVLRRRGRRPHTVLDLDWRHQFWSSEAEAREAISPALDHVTIAIGNRDECRVAVDTEDPDKAADRLLERGLDAAIIKLGGDGVMVATAAGVRERIPPFPVDVVCGLGAGDAFGGSICHGLVEGWSLVEAARFGNAAGAIVASRLMCADDMPTIAEVEKLLEASNAA